MNVYPLQCLRFNLEQLGEGSGETEATSRLLAALRAPADTASGCVESSDSIQRGAFHALGQLLLYKLPLPHAFYKLPLGEFCMEWGNPKEKCARLFVESLSGGSLMVTGRGLEATFYDVGWPTI